MTMQIASRAFAPGEAIPVRYTCDGDDRSPPLTWSGIPERARSLAVICDDPDAPGGTFRHWAIYDIPPDADGLPDGFDPSEPVDPTRHAVNDFGRDRYGGPCPPTGHGLHHYHFRLLALDVDHLSVRDGAKVADVEAAARPHIIETAELVGTYAR